MSSPPPRAPGEGESAPSPRQGRGRASMLGGCYEARGSSSCRAGLRISRGGCHSAWLRRCHGASPLPASPATRLRPGSAAGRCRLRGRSAPRWVSVETSGLSRSLRLTNTLRRRSPPSSTSTESGLALRRGVSSRAAKAVVAGSGSSPRVLNPPRGVLGARSRERYPLPRYTADPISTTASDRGPAFLV